MIRTSQATRYLHHRFPDRERRGKIVPAHADRADEVPDSEYPMCSPPAACSNIGTPAR